MSGPADFGIIGANPSGSFGGFGPSGPLPGPIESNSLSSIPPTVTAVSDEKEVAVVHHYVAKPMVSGEEKEIRADQIVFCIRTPADEKPNFMQGDVPLPALSLPQINVYCRHASRKFVSLLTTNPQNLPGDLDIKALALLKAAPEHNWKFLKDELAKLESHPLGKIVALNYADGILGLVNIIGIHRNPMAGTFVSELGATILNVAVDGSTYVQNSWEGGVCQGSSLWLILKRLFNPKTNSYEEFQFVPFVGGQDNIPTLQDRSYKDHTGTTQFGPCYYVGEVLDNENPMTHSTLCRQSAGLESERRLIANAIVQTPVIKVLMRTRPGLQDHWLL